ncbi:MAG TPA: galactokinase [Candidatus Acidoferrales bacterium]|nr:galactokinase [Candidatus Acidoferrales bacterium]
METLSASNDLFRAVREKFFGSYGKKDEVIVVRSPGRINLIGEHTDYNDGLVLPAAINRSINFVISRRKDSRCRLYASDIQDSCEFDVNAPEKSSKRWANYLIGVVDQLQKNGYALHGFDCLFGGDIPIGAGLSSSAAIEAGLAFALNEIFELGIERVQLAAMAQESEHQFVGVMCGIMDQFANLIAKEDSVFQLDCRSLDYRYIPFDMKNLSLVLCDTGIKHDLANSEYNLRRRQCESGVRKIASVGHPVSRLRDVSIDLLENCRHELEPVVYDRCRYVLEENDRVRSASKALEMKEYEKLGDLLYASHDGLRNKYSVSCNELDLLVDTASQIDGVLGARMMGAGFGGCTINLIEKDSLQDFRVGVKREYQRKTGKEPEFYECKLVSGADVVSR